MQRAREPVTCRRLLPLPIIVTALSVNERSQSVHVPARLFLPPRFPLPRVPEPDLTMCTTCTKNMHLATG